MDSLVKKYLDLPTIMDYGDELAVMADLINIGSSRLIRERIDLVALLRKIEDSHQDNGVFEFKQIDVKLFLDFVSLLSEIKSLAPDIDFNIENMMNTFRQPGFD